MASSALSMYGNTTCQTPNLDRLASKSTVFENAYCNYPLCAPSRFSMAAGLLPSKIGAFDNGAEFPSSIPTYAHNLRAAGYQTILSGKMHFVGADQLHGFEERLTSDLYPADFQWAANWRETTHQDVTDSRMFKVSGVCVNNPQIEYDERVAFEARRKLLQIAAEDECRPFFMQVSFTHPHDPYLCKQDYWDRYENAKIPMPLVPGSAIKDRDPHSQILMQQSGIADREVSNDEIRRVRRAYYGAISFVDDMVGNLLDTLDETGMTDNTVILFTSDHGEMLGERGMWLKKNFFEPALKIPLLLYVPGSQSARISEIVSLVDILPTLVAVGSSEAEPKVIESLDGINLLTQIDNPVSNSTRRLYAEITCEGTPAPMFLIRQDGYKYTYCENYPDQLYNLDDDKNELHNLAGNPGYVEIQQQLKQQVLETWDCEAIGVQVRLSQARRRLINKAFSNGDLENWDYKPAYDDSAWFRGDTSYNDWAYAPLLKK